MKHECMQRGASSLTPQAVLQQEGELGVAVRHVRLLVAQRRNDVPQSRQALVDGLAQG